MQYLNALIPRNGAVIFHTRFHQVRKILFSLLGGGHSTPDADNHRCSFLLLYLQHAVSEKSIAGREGSCHQPTDRRRSRSSLSRSLSTDCSPSALCAIAKDITTDGV